MRRPHARLIASSNDNNNNASKDKMDAPFKLHVRPNNPTTRPGKSKSLSTFLSLTLTLMLILLSSLYYYYLFVKPEKGVSFFRDRYRIVIDGGSTGTRIHVYRVKGRVRGFNFEEVGVTRVTPGLSAYVEDPDGAGRSVRELVEYAKGRVPSRDWRETEIRLMATAGLRLLDLRARELVLDACRKVFRGSGFKFVHQWASVIDGLDEGLYAWVAANYALGSLGGGPMETTGIIELGGASAQVTFVSNEPMPPEFTRTVKFGNVTYTIYSHSFLHFGQNVAFETLRESLLSADYQSVVESLKEGMVFDPCTPKGYTYSMASGSTENTRISSALHSRGNFSECRSVARMLLQKGKEKCSFQQCNIGSTFVPKIRGKFLATENFFYTSKFFRLGRRTFLSDLIKAGEQFCGEDWLKLKKKYHMVNDEDLMHYCFSSAYIVTLLHDGLGIPLDDERILVTNQIGNVPLDWALGAFILQSTANMDTEHNPDWIGTIISDDSPTLLSIIAVAILVLGIAWSISKWRKPQIKTIYDLEKGRYIVTRIARTS